MKKQSPALTSSERLSANTPDDYAPVALLLSRELLILDINPAGANHLFGKKKSALANRSFIKVLEEFGIDTQGLCKAIKSAQKSLQHSLTLINRNSGKSYTLVLISLPENSEAGYAITMSLCNDFSALQSYIDALINHLPGAVYWKDKQGRYLGCNKFVATMAGFTNTNDIIGKTDYELCWREFADEWQQLDNKVIQEDITIEREEQARLASGALITELTFKTALKNEHGEIIGVIGTSLDISKRKAAFKLSQVAAEAADKAKSEFIRNMEHELRTPFSGVYSIVRMLFETEQDPEKKELLELTYQSAKEFLNLLNNIIDFSRDQLDSTAVMTKKIDLKETISNVVTMERAVATSKNLLLTMDYPEDLPTIFISDPHRLQRLLLNLVGNAIKFTTEGTVTVVVKLAKQVDEKHFILQLVVTDTGIGIAEDKQQYIYEKFYRLSPANQNKYAGAGLGLFVVRQIIDDLEGEIDVVSNPNKGSSFICTLPFKRPLLDIITDKT